MPFSWLWGTKVTPMEERPLGDTKQESSPDVKALLAQAYARGYSDRGSYSSQPKQVDPSTQSKTVVPNSLRDFSANYPFSTAFFLGSSLTITLLSAAYLTRSILVTRPWRRDLVAAVEMLGRRIAIAERQRSLEGVRVTADRTSSTKLPIISKSIALVQSTEKAPPAISRTMDALPHPSPQPIATIEAISSQDKVQSPHMPFRLPPTPQPMPTIKAVSSQDKVQPPHTPVRLPRPSILAFHDLRSGLGKMGPMPVVDVGNPNLISFGEEATAGGKKRVPYSTGL